MYCMHCGQQLPDNANFCFSCGEKPRGVLATDTDPVKPDEGSDPVADSAREPVRQSELEPTPAPAPQPAPAPAPSPAPAPDPAPVSDSDTTFARGKAAKTSRIPRITNAPKIPKAPKVATPAPSKKLIGIVIAVVAVAVILASALFGGGSSADRKVEIPDPEFYFALPISSIEEDDGVTTYTINANGDEDLSDQVFAYINVLRYDYGFILNAHEEDEGYINTDLFSSDALDEVQVIYLHDASGNSLEVKATRDVVLVRGMRYTGPSAVEPLGGSDADESAGVPDEGFEDPVQQEEPQADPWATGDLAVLPDFAEFDSTGTFSYSTAFFATTVYDVDRLYLSYSSKDVNAVYQTNHYVEMLYDLGWQLEFISEDNSFYLYHPDVDAPSLPDAEKAQIYVQGHVNSSGDTAFVSFMLPEEICINNYEDKWQWNVEWRENNEREKAEEERNSSSSGSSSSSSGSSSSSSLNRDLYNNDPICGVCNGDGDCSKCGGSGYLYSSASGEKDRNCYKCNGSGNCRSCGGDGRL